MAGIEVVTDPHLIDAAAEALFRAGTGGQSAITWGHLQDVDKNLWREAVKRGLNYAHEKLYG